ncbi:hypothetical protein [Actinomycetospora termitidis]|uniref:Secreted protein n=1 Tax=Actinomycetospora termitidis TaxID=3053470 RepID=A0ABT7MDP0_9PSEU|nr:hypothetical protein [Actinomycetospora sp. Odt1-22]MDL5158780.1 hypothetical protein [Actinomycetospora sp. Odt1-22]
MVTVRVCFFREVGLAAVVAHGAPPGPLPAAVRLLEFDQGVTVARLAVTRRCGGHGCLCRQNLYRHLDVLIERALGGP